MLYLLHSIGGDENEWHGGANQQMMLDNLIAVGKVAPKLVLMPDGQESLVRLLANFEYLNQQNNILTRSE